MTKCILISSFILLCTSVIESSILSNIIFLPAIPDLSLICVVYFSVHNGKIIGESTGFISGLFLDFLSACPFGFNTLFRTVIGYAGGNFNKTLNTSGFIVPLILGIIATVVKIFIVNLVTLLFPFANLIPYKLISTDCLFQIVFNAVLTPLMFRLLRHFDKSILLKPEEIY